MQKQSTQKQKHFTTFRASVEVIEPGRVIRETIDDGTITTYIFKKLDEKKTAVTIMTEGRANFLMAFISRRLLTPVYETEIRMMESYAHGLIHVL